MRVEAVEVKRNWIPWYIVIAPVAGTALALLYKYAPAVANCLVAYVVVMILILAFNYGAHKNDPPDDEEGSAEG